MKLIRMIYFFDFKYGFSWKDKCYIVLMFLIFPVFFFKGLDFIFSDGSDDFGFKLLLFLLGFFTGSMLFADKHFNQKLTFLFIYNVKPSEIAGYFTLKNQLVILLLTWVCIENCIIYDLGNDQIKLLFTAILMTGLGNHFSIIFLFLVKLREYKPLLVSFLLLIPIFFSINDFTFAMIYGVFLLFCYNILTYRIIQKRGTSLTYSKGKTNRKLKITNNVAIPLLKEISLLWGNGRLIISILALLPIQYLFYYLGTNLEFFIILFIFISFLLHDTLTLNIVGLEGDCINYYRSFPGATKKLLITKWKTIFLITNLLSCGSAIVWALLFGHFFLLVWLPFINTSIGSLYLLVAYRTANFQSGGFYRVRFSGILFSILFFLSLAFFVGHFLYSTFKGS